MSPHIQTLISLRDFQEINYPKKRTTEAQSTQRENFCISFGTFFYLEVSNRNLTLKYPKTNSRTSSRIYSTIYQKFRSSTKNHPNR